MSDTLTVRKTPSEEEDARRRREGDGERGEKSVGAFSETAATEVIRPCIAERETGERLGRTEKSTERDGEGGARKGRKGRWRDRFSSEMSLTEEADRKKGGEFVYLSP